MLLGRDAPLLSACPWLSACHLAVPLAVSLLHLSLSSPASSLSLCCYLSVSLFPMSFQSSDWFFYSVSPSPSILYPPFRVCVSSIPWLSLAYPCLFSHCWAHVEHIVRKTMDIYIHPPIPLPILPSFPFCVLIHEFLCSFIPPTNVLESL